MRTAALLLGPDARGLALLIEDGRIAASSSSGGFDPSAVRDAERLACADAVIAPGEVNAHTHLYSGLVPLGMPAPDPPPQNFLEILQRIWWRLDRALDAASLEAAARLYAAEALLAGTTTLVDHHESPDLVEGSLDILAEACEGLGVRALLCYGATERNGGRAEARRGLAECRRFHRENRRTFVRCAVGLHAGFTVSDETIREALRLAAEEGLPLHLHAAEDRLDVEDARRRGYRGCLDRLEACGPLPRGSILAHGVHLDAEEVRRSEELGLWIVQNPRSNRNNRVGYPKALGESRRVALGTDGFPSRMEEELRALREEAARHGEDPEVAQRRLEAGRRLASEHFGLPLGRLEPGSGADVVVRRGGEVRHVVVAGRLVVRDGRLLTGDLEVIRETARSEARRLWERMREVRG
jgi:cytosine/adenosine deaminase-related metal-dependent hydrolase